MAAVKIDDFFKAISFVKFEGLPNQIRNQLYEDVH
jgi:hypothetical protein